MRWDDFSAFDFVDEMVFVLGADSDNRPVFRFLNHAGLLRLGVDRRAVEDRPAYEVFAGRAAQSVYRRHCAAWTAGVSCDYRIALQLKTETIWAHTRLHAVLGADGELSHMVGTSRDITQEYNRLFDSVVSDASLRDAEDLIYIAAHDLRSPLCNLKTLTSMIRSDFVDHGDGKAQLIDLIDQISDKALTTVSGVLEQVLGSDGGTRRTRFDFGNMCDDVLVMLDPMNRHRASYPRAEIEAEPMVVQILLRNLIDNGLKHSGREKVDVSIDLSPVNAERLLFTVRDNGIGFADRGPKPGSMGFGLTGLQRVLRARQGTLRVSNAPSGQGAQVQVELPGRIAAITDNGPQMLRPH